MSVAVPPTVPFGATLGRLIGSEALWASTVELARRQVVYSCLNGDRSIYLGEKGQVKASAPSRDGKECLLGIYSAGEVFGELCLVSEARMETVVAMTPSVLRRISAAKVLVALSDAGLREEFVRHLACRLFEQQQLITDLVTADSESRLAAILLHLGRKLGRRKANMLLIDARISQEELSGMVGTTRSRVGLFLKRFRDAGLIARNQGCFLAIDEVRLDDFVTRGRAKPGPAQRDVLANPTAA
jgi:CRP/FNR family transcriptional regulator, cyclic AMP receptor protein